jgi:hypothetical protein
MMRPMRNGRHAGHRWRSCRRAVPDYGLSAFPHLDWSRSPISAFQHFSVSAFDLLISAFLLLITEPKRPNLIPVNCMGFFSRFFCRQHMQKLHRL